MKLDLAPRPAQPPERLEISEMVLEDIPDVMRIETLCFPTTWPQNAFYNEVEENKLAHYFVGRLGNRIVAYGGIWVILEDSHVTTIAVHPEFRSRKYGEQLFLRLLDEAIERGASWITLEVRESNAVAQNLYRKYGFTVVSSRHAYYSDNRENALVMWAGNVKGPLYRNRLRALRATVPE
ncbi:MAG: ribosomal protein S18-alanine N-acetyltransferase [Candidatus Eremiobacteraeota bacterium]|nr:ribosomal protein S18-alanine N-acetyltransferase [Candidatus Eremiobacteraeota bacterium]MBV9972745.1 ribosomal protein S18-alanine N-acetyltransferase [Candidatus Eremiobacteraeota bacterium]